MLFLVPFYGLILWKKLKFEHTMNTFLSEFHESIIYENKKRSFSLPFPPGAQAKWCSVTKQIVKPAGRKHSCVLHVYFRQPSCVVAN